MRGRVLILVASIPACRPFAWPSRLGGRGQALRASDDSWAVELQQSSGGADVAE